jgi:hypothetical protein
MTAGASSDEDMKRALKRFVDCVWIAFLIAVMAGGAILFAQLSHDTARATFIFWP